MSTIFALWTRQVRGPARVLHLLEAPRKSHVGLFNCTFIVFVFLKVMFDTPTGGQGRQAERTQGTEACGSGSWTYGGRLHEDTPRSRQSRRWVCKEAGQDMWMGGGRSGGGSGGRRGGRRRRTRGTLPTAPLRPPATPPPKSIFRRIPPCVIKIS